MKLLSHSTLLSSLMLSSISLLVLGAPTNTLTLNTRDDDYSFQQCVPTGPGSCTIYMATSDPDVPDYRTAGLFDNNCNLLQAIMSTKTNPKLTLKGTLPNYVDLLIDTSALPNGFISYNSQNTPLGNMDTLGRSMACFKPPNSDGTGCRRAFSCA